MESPIVKTLVAVLSLVTLMSRDVKGHGRLIEPPSRSSAWRYGFHTPVNYDDNQLFCGGYDVQWHQNGGRCGICGDPWNGRRENEAGGRYATGTIVRKYTEGQTIAVKLDITTNHGGFFEFRICPNNSPQTPATESCFIRHVLSLPDGNQRYQLPSGTRVFSLQLVLPRGLTCSQCVLQWKWNTASNWDCENGRCCKGCGPQEQFMGCADVTISPTSGSRLYSAISSGGQQNTSPNQIGANINVCQATAQWKAKYAYADQWCQTQCAVGNCPAQYCENGCRGSQG